jgi:hypothetical protein
MSIFVAIVIVLLVLGIIAIGIVTWPATPAEVPTLLKHYYWIITNGAGENFFPVPIVWPYITKGVEVFINYVFQFPIATTTHPSLPVLITLPTAASKLSGLVSMWSYLPAGETDVEVVQYGDAVAFRFKPSGNYFLSGQLTHIAPTVFTITYAIP